MELLEKGNAVTLTCDSNELTLIMDALDFFVGIHKRDTPFTFTESDLYVGCPIDEYETFETQLRVSVNIL